jgi:acyl-CoA dehydrogenase
VKVMALLSECVGAKGFERDTYFEMALRDIQLFPGLESSAHINLGLTAQFAARYFGEFDRALAEPESLHAAEQQGRGRISHENPYLMQARSTAVNTISFPPTLKAFRPLRSVANVRLFARQVKAVRTLLRAAQAGKIDSADMQFTMALGQCLATIAYGQLIAEHARHLALPREWISILFHLLVTDLNSAGVSFASLPAMTLAIRNAARRLVAVPRTTQADWDFISARMDGA